MRTILPIFLKLNFTPNTLGCYGLIRWILTESQRLSLIQIQSVNLLKMDYDVL